MLKSLNITPTNNGFIINYKVKVEEDKFEERTLVAITPQEAMKEIIPLLQLQYESIKGEIEDAARIDRITSILHGEDATEPGEQEDEDL